MTGGIVPTALEVSTMSVPVKGSATAGSEDRALLQEARGLVAAIDRAQAAYDRIAASARMILPFVSPERAARIRLAMALTERGLLAARYAATAAEQMAPLKQAEAATATIETTAVP